MRTAIAILAILITGCTTMKFDDSGYKIEEFLPIGNRYIEIHTDEKLRMKYRNDRKRVDTMVENVISEGIEEYSGELRYEDLADNSILCDEDGNLIITRDPTL